ncbi:MAG: ribosome maturation factor RimP [Candidatus Desulfofervidaceae bacterium]|nr:ribosome maturation factor RimP [Candidatus Desulfofervidaceae bacterium]
MNLSLYTTKVIEIVEKLARPILESEGLELVDVEFQRETQGWVLRVYIDKEGGVSLDDCTGVSQQLSAALDVEDPIDTAYTLEVSSPGLTRPLKKARDYERYKGQLVQIKTYRSVEGRKVFKGKLIGLEDDVVKIEIEGKVWEIPLKDIAKANLDFKL